MSYPERMSLHHIFKPAATGAAALGAIAVFYCGSGDLLISSVGGLAAGMATHAGYDDCRKSLGRRLSAFYQDRKPH